MEFDIKEKSFDLQLRSGNEAPLNFSVGFLQIKKRTLTEGR